MVRLKAKRNQLNLEDLYVVEDVKKGESFNENNLRIIRPGYGEQPKFYRLILGKKANSDIKKGTPMDWKYVG